MLIDTSHWQDSDRCNYPQKIDLLNPYVCIVYFLCNSMIEFFDRKDFENKALLLVAKQRQKRRKSTKRK